MPNRVQKFVVLSLALLSAVFVACSAQFDSTSPQSASGSRNELIERNSGSVRLSVWRVRQDSLVLDRASVGLANDGASLVKVSLNAERIRRIRAMVDSNSMQRHLTAALRIARDLNPRARITLRPQNRILVDRDTAEQRSIYVIQGVSSKRARAVTLVGEQQGVTRFRHTIKQSLVDAEWRVTTSINEMYDSSGSVSSVLVAEYSHDRADVGSAGAVGGMVDDALKMFAKSVLPTELQAATPSERPCFEQEWDLYLAEQDRDAKRETYLEWVDRCDTDSSPDCLADMNNALGAYEQAEGAVAARNAALNACMHQFVGQYAGPTVIDGKVCDVYEIWESIDGGENWFFTGYTYAYPCHGEYET